MLIIKLGDPDREKYLKLFQIRLEEHAQKMMNNRDAKPWDFVATFNDGRIQFSVGRPARYFYFNGIFPPRNSWNGEPLIENDFFSIEIVNGSNVRPCYVELTPDEASVIRSRIKELSKTAELLKERLRREQEEKVRQEEWKKDQKALEFLKEEVERVVGV